jgi:Tfp pilus assembly protein PilP
MKKIFKLLIILVLMLCLTACSKNKPTTEVEEVKSKAELCAEELLNIKKFKTYAWSYQEVQGKFNLDVDYACTIEMYGCEDSEVYFIKALCYITDGNDVDIEYLEEKQLE